MMRRSTPSTATLAAVLAAALLSACAPLPPAAPDNARPQLPAQWSTAAEAGTAPIAAQWWQQLGDTQLDALVQLALANNTDVLTAAARVQEAQANLAATDAARSPQLNATLGAQAGRSLTVLGARFRPKGSCAPC